MDVHTRIVTLESSPTLPQNEHEGEDQREVFQTNRAHRVRNPLAGRLR